MHRRHSFSYKSSALVSDNTRSTLPIILMGNPVHNVINRCVSLLNPSLFLLTQPLSVLGSRPSSRAEMASTISEKLAPTQLQRSKSFLVRSIQKFKAKASPMDMTSDDDISFSSPMPSELCSPSPMGSDFSELELWDPLNGGDPFGPPSMELGGAFPKHSIPLQSQTLPAQFRALSNSTSPPLSENCSRENISNSDPHDLNCSPTTPHYCIDRDFVQCSTTSHYLSGARTSPSLDRNLSSSSSSASLVSCQSSPSPLARSRSYKLLSGPQTSHLKNLPSRRLSSSFSLQDLKSIKSNSPNKHHMKTLPPSSPSSFTGHQPGLEYRVIRRLKHSRSRSHVPIGTREF